MNETSSQPSRSRFTARLLRTHSATLEDTYNAHRPSSKFFHRDSIIFHDFALVYFSQFVGSTQSQLDQKRRSKKTNVEDQTTLWKLWLNSLVWEPIKTQPSTDLHFPLNRVSFKQSSLDATTAFLHGQCGRIACPRKYHFFELEIFSKDKPQMTLTRQQNLTEKRPTVLRRFVKFASGKPKSEAPCKKLTSSSKSASCHSLLAIAKREDGHLGEGTSHRLSIGSAQTFMSEHLVPSTSSESSMDLVNWSRQMSLNGNENRLSEQLKYAKEMGFTDNEIWAALDVTNKNTQKAYEPFESISAMIDALSLAQKNNNRSSNSNLVSTSRFTGSTTTLPVYLDDRKQNESSAKLPSWISSTALASSSPLQTMPSNRSSQSSGVNRSMSFNDSLGMRRSMAQSMGSLAIHQQARNPNTGRSSVQRLIDTFENENRRHFEEFQRINHELRRKLENTIHQEETLRDLLRLRQEKIRQQEILLKNQSELEKRLENANRRLQDMLKDVQLREADIIRHQGDYDALQRRHEAETRKAEEVKQTLNAEIGRLVRDQERQEQILRQNESLREEIQSKDAEIRRLAEPNPEMQELNLKLEQLNADLGKLMREKRELEENQLQGPVCGVCMDNRREVIFLPCLHFTCCKRCSDAMDQCAICRLRIMGKIEFFQ